MTLGYLQRYHLERLCRKLNVDVAEIDASITYRENKKIILRCFSLGQTSHIRNDIPQIDALAVQWRYVPDGLLIEPKPEIELGEPENPTGLPWREVFTSCLRQTAPEPKGPFAPWETIFQPETLRAIPRPSKPTRQKRRETARPRFTMPSFSLRSKLDSNLTFARQIFSEALTRQMPDEGKLRLFW